MMKYDNPLVSRYASDEMNQIFSNEKKYSIWRQLWVWLAIAEREIGIKAITLEQIEEMERCINTIDFKIVHSYEKKLKHEVMAHIYAFGDQAPLAKPIIHLGATSAYVIDNTDLITIKSAAELIIGRMLPLIDKMANFSKSYANIPTLGFTHFQAAQLTTVGKRATLWIHSLWSDLEDLQSLFETMPLRGVKGTTGTLASFKALCNDYEQVKKMDEIIMNFAGFSSVIPVSGQTYDRKIDVKFLQLLSRIAQSCHKITNDLRLLQSMKEIEEPYSSMQIGSSAMAYKRNPMKSERIASLSKFVMSNSFNGDLVASSQWFERTLDDSANKRISLPQSFLAIDGIILLMSEVFSDLTVNEKVISRHIQEELPFMITENIIMKAVENGGDRQLVHEKIRVLSQEAAYDVKHHGMNNTLVSKILNDPLFQITEKEINDLLDTSKLTGYAYEQTIEYVNDYIFPYLEKHKKLYVSTDNFESI